MQPFWATYITRKNRFVITCKKDNRLFDVYLPNPGRLWEILIPGNSVLVEETDTGLKYKATFIKKNDKEIVCIDSIRISRITPQLLVDWLKSRFNKKFKLIKNEFSIDRHRFDALIQIDSTYSVVEIKSCTLFYKGLGMFPDAPTKRGYRHINKLCKLTDMGFESILVFAIQNSSVTHFLPDFHTDPLFSDALYRSKDKVKIIPITMDWSKKLTKPRLLNVCPIPWSVYEQQRGDRGAYLLIIELKHPLEFSAGVKKRFYLNPGFYIYVGSAMKNLAARIRRHKSKKKRIFWHIDHLTTAASHITDVPIVSNERLECLISKDISLICNEIIGDFGCSDCNCKSHLFYFNKNPLSSIDIIQIIQNYRLGRLKKIIDNI